MAGLPGLNQYYARINVSCSRHNAAMPVRLDPTAPRSRVKHSTTEPPAPDHYFELEYLGHWLDMVYLPPPGGIL